MGLLNVLPYPNHKQNSPTACWHQLMNDEVSEQDQAKRLKALHESVETALNKIRVSTSAIDGLATRLECAEDRISNLERTQADEDTAGTIRALEVTNKEITDKLDSRMSAVEDDIKAATAREFMAKAASRANQSTVLRAQRKAAEACKVLRQQADATKTAALSTLAPTSV